MFDICGIRAVSYSNPVEIPLHVDFHPPHLRDWEVHFQRRGSRLDLLIKSELKILIL